MVPLYQSVISSLLIRLESELAGSVGVYLNILETQKRGHH